MWKYWKIQSCEVCEFCILLYYARKSVTTFRNSTAVGILLGFMFVVIRFMFVVIRFTVGSPDQMAEDILMYRHLLILSDFNFISINFDVDIFSFC